MKWQQLDRLERARGGWRGGSTGYVYIPAGSRARIPDPHTLDIAELYVRLVESSAELVAFLPEPHCHAQLGTLELKPDAKVHTRTSSGEYLWFLEVDRGTEWRAALGRKMRAYVSAYERWPHKTFPSVLFTVPDNERRQFVESVAVKQDVALFKAVLFSDAVWEMCR